MAAVRLKGGLTRKARAMKPMFIDVRKAHLTAACDKPHTYVQLPVEAEAPPGVCGRLLRWLYGMRGAAQRWENEFGGKMLSLEFTRGKSTSVVFHRESDETTLVVHGDYFTFLGYPESLNEILKQMKAWWDIKLRAIIGDEAGDDSAFEGSAVLFATGSRTAVDCIFSSSLATMAISASLRRRRR